MRLVSNWINKNKGVPNMKKDYKKWLCIAITGFVFLSCVNSANALQFGKPNKKTYFKHGKKIENRDYERAIEK